MVVMSSFEKDSHRIHYAADGEGQPVLALPGWGGDIGELEPIRHVLKQRFRVIAADLPGSGRSTPQPREYTPNYFREDAETFLAMLDHLSAAPSHLIGFSDGGEVALLMAALRPDAVLSVVAWGAAGQLVAPPGMVDAFYNLIDDPIPPLRDFSKHLSHTYGDDTARAMTQSESKALRGIIEAGGDISRSRASRIGCRVLLLTGEHDPFCPPGLVSELAAAIPKGEFVRVDDADHDIHNSHAEWLAKTIDDWI
jgi:pimeloyl-ACP methyl ester carboxylesterase